MSIDNNTPPEISIIVLTFNREKELRKAIESIYSQKLKNFEVILIDNGNSDDYSKSLSEYLVSKNNLRYLKFKENTEYLGVRLNQGISIARGTYISFLMDDDFLMNDSLKALYKEIHESHLDFVYGKVKTIDFKTGSTTNNSFSSKDWEFGLTKKVNPIHITSVIIRKQIIDIIGGFDESLKRSFDLDLWERVFNKCKVKRIDKVISCVTVNNLNSVTGKVSLEKIVKKDSYPLQGYWSDRKSVSISGNIPNFKNTFNSFGFPWVITESIKDTDALISKDTSNFTNFLGKKFLYSSENFNNTQNSYDGFISPVYSDNNRVKHILRPHVSLSDILKLDKFPIVYSQNSLRVIC